MNSTPTEPPAWSPARRWLLILLVFLVHIGLIAAFTDRKPPLRRAPAPAPVLGLASAENELLALNDPTLFALPHRQSFAGEAWLKPTTNTVAPFRWSEPPRLRSLPGGALGAAFTQFMATNSFPSLAFATKPAPDVLPPAAVEIGAPAPSNSTLRITGALAPRRWLNRPVLPSFHASDLVTNSVAQVLVNADGLVFSATLLVASGVKAADQRALDLARAARFEPVHGTQPSLTFGMMIFEWHTEPPLAEAKPAP